MARRLWIATRNLIRSVVVVAVAAVVKEHARLVVAVDQRYGKSRRNLLDQRQLPAAQQRVRQRTPVVAEFPAATERQIVKYACREVVRQIDLRQSPIQIFPVRQREVRRTDQR